MASLENSLQHVNSLASSSTEYASIKSSIHSTHTSTQSAPANGTPSTSISGDADSNSVEALSQDKVTADPVLTRPKSVLDSQQDKPLHGEANHSSESTLEVNELIGTSTLPPSYYRCEHGETCTKCARDDIQRIKKRMLDGSHVIKYLEKLERTIERLHEQLKSPDDAKEKEQSLEETTTDLILGISRKKKRAYANRNSDVDDEDEDIQIPGSSKKSKKHILTVYRLYGRTQETNIGGAMFREIALPSSFELEINSLPIIKILRKIIDYYPQYSLEAESVTLPSPYRLLFHFRKELMACCKAQDTDEETRQHVELLLDFMRNENDSISQGLDILEAETEEPEDKIVSFNNCWLLFPPGTIVYSSQDGDLQAYMVESLEGMEQLALPNGRLYYEPLALQCWSIDYDGTHFGRKFTTLSVLSFHGSKKVKNLEVRAANYLRKEENNQIRKKLINRGKRFWAFEGAHHQEYLGNAWLKAIGDVCLSSCARHEVRAESSGRAYGQEKLRVMIDHESYQRKFENTIQLIGKATSALLDKPMREDHEIGCTCYTCKARRDFVVKKISTGMIKSPYSQYDLIDPKTGDPNEMILLLCPYRVFGFGLRSKDWKALNVDDLRPVIGGQRGFKRLVLEKAYKDIIQALVKSYIDKTSDFRDLIAGKGRGLVALLHGAPGTGKTLTAECVADHFNRPLYMISCGDIGTTPEEVESKLEEVFEYAVKWKAVLLLDEADVFLQERNYQDLSRNAVVSIFLRVLEYFDGILFLTTNRIGQFDEAFRSRLHLTLHFPQLKAPERKKVLFNFLAELKMDDEDRDELKEQVGDMITLQKLNGRQIRNTVRTAIALAENQGKPLQAEHFETVLKMTRDFTEYLDRLKRADPDQLARLQGNRN